MEPLGNVNKGFTCATRVAYPLTRHVNARVCTKVPIFRYNHFFPTNPHLNYELHQGVAPPGLTYLTYRWKAKQGREETEHKQSKRLCTRVYVLITRSHL